MIRCVVSTNAQGAIKYYTEALARGDYYSQGQEIEGTWHGKGAWMLGLAGSDSPGLVTSEQFAAMAMNRHPCKGGPVTQRTISERRVGYDINFHAPKSISVLYEFTQDPAILQAFLSSVRETMKQMEAEAKCRVRVGGASHDRTVSNLCYAEFLHHTARPVGNFPDPHLHAHCFTFNAVWDAAEQKWKAGQFGDLKRDMPYFESCFHARLASKLVELGYAIERRGKGWEIAAVPESVVRFFSRRTAEIEAKAAELGIEDAERKSQLGATTRNDKDDSYPLNVLRKVWPQISPVNVKEFIGKGTPGNGSFGKGIDQSATQAIDYAIGMCFERESVVTERELLAAAIRRSLGAVPESKFHEALQNDPRFIRRELDGVMMVTTKEVMAEEEWMIAFAKNGRGTRAPIALNHVIKDERLNDRQRAAVLQAMTSTNRVISIWGGAGTGKTTLLNEFVNGVYDARGILRTAESPQLVTVLAPTADAGRGVLRSEGHSNANTIAKFLQSASMQQSARDGILWVDEAGLLGSKTMAALFRVAERINARVILSGDPGQHRAVERGDPLRILEKFAGVVSVVVEKIIRQRGLYKSAVEHLSRGDTDKGFDALQKLGSIREMDEAEAHRHIASDYATSVEKGRSALVVSPTHAEGGRVTEAIRDELKRRQMLKGKGLLFDRLEDLRLTEEQRRRADHYEKGLVVQFHQNLAGSKAGKKYTVVGITPMGVMLDNMRVLPFDEAAKFNVFRRHENATEICRGDSIRITANGKSLGNPKSQVPGAKPHALNNGAVHKVKGFTKNGDIVLENGWVVSREYGHFTHGYCTTSHASQGKTVDVVFIAQSANSFGATSAEQFYVSVSRGRRECVVYTDDADGLRQRIKQTSVRRAAVELSESQHEAERRERRAVEIARQVEEHRASQWRKLSGPEKSLYKEARGIEHE